MIKIWKIKPVWKGQGKGACSVWRKEDCRETQLTEDSLRNSKVKRDQFPLVNEDRTRRNRLQFQKGKFRLNIGMNFITI